MNKLEPVKRFAFKGNVTYWGTDEEVLIPVEYKEKDKETRGVWFSTVANIDIPKDTEVTPESIEAQKKFLLGVIDKLKEFHMNTVVFQVRPVNDALYDSELNPWSRYLTGTEGKYPGFDPFGFFMENIKGKNINVHAWINPYRAGRDDILAAGLTKEEYCKQLDPKNFCYKHPECTILTKKNLLLLDPTNQKVRDFVSDSCLEIAKKYNVKAIHIDDYFYPYEDICDPDEERKAKEAGYDYIPDFRRHNVDLLIEEISNKLKTLDRKVEFGISPFAIHRTNSKLFKEEDRNKDSAWEFGSNNAPQCLSCYAGLYADVYKWMKEGWIDYVVPQDYWSLDNTTINEETKEERCVVRYADIAKWWNDICKETNTKLYMGQGFFNLRDDNNHHWGNYEEIKYELKYNQTLENVNGTIFFTYHSFTQGNNECMAKAREELKTLWTKEVEDI